MTGATSLGAWRSSYPNLSLLDGVEHQEPSGAGLHHRLQESVRVDGRFRECLQQPIAPVVIADEKMGWHP